MYVKRIIGSAGRTRVDRRRARCYINGAPLDEPYVRNRRPWDVPEVTLTAREYFVIGDNRGMRASRSRFRPRRRVANPRQGDFLTRRSSVGSRGARRSLLRRRLRVALARDAGRTRHSRRLDALRDEVNASTKDGLGTALRAAQIGSYFTDDVVVDLGEGPRRSRAATT